MDCLLQDTAWSASHGISVKTDIITWNLCTKIQDHMEYLLPDSITWNLCFQTASCGIPLHNNYCVDRMTFLWQIDNRDFETYTPRRLLNVHVICAQPGYRRSHIGTTIPRSMHTRCWCTGWENWHLDSVPNSRLVRSTADCPISMRHHEYLPTNRYVRKPTQQSLMDQWKSIAYKGHFTGECYFCKDPGPIGVTTSVLCGGVWMSKMLNALVGSQISDATSQHNNQSENWIFIPQYGHS